METLKIRLLKVPKLLNLFTLQPRKQGYEPHTKAESIARDCTFIPIRKLKNQRPKQLLTDIRLYFEELLPRHYRTLFSPPHVRE